VPVLADNSVEFKLHSKHSGEPLEGLRQNKGKDRFRLLIGHSTAGFVENVLLASWRATLLPKGLKVCEFPPLCWLGTRGWPS
jgi:hypothetical protein